MRIAVLAVLAATVALPTPARAAGDAEAGRQLAIEWCSQCHDVMPGGQMRQEPPAFAAIAVYRSPEQIRARIVFPHQAMPEYAQILGLDADDLTAYIVSLEAR
jgi:mono/diheme cytochrome c family protein